MALIPATETPPITITRKLAPSGSNCDAIVVLILGASSRPDFSDLPAAEQWQAMHRRSRVAAGQVRSCTLPNSKQTLAVLGYLAADATPFEQLALAGRVVREALAREARNLGVAVIDNKPTPTRDSALEALLSAALVQDFPLPSFRSKPGGGARLRRLIARGDAGINVARVSAIAAGQNLARWLTALPPNKLNALAYRRILRHLAATHGLRLSWLSEAVLRRAGAGAFLAVAAGNARRDAAGIAHLSYRPRHRSAAKPDVALVGKGILFDTGGTNLKTHRGMLDMHTDMAGSAVALATLVTLAQLQAPIAADAWLAITENRAGATAYQPQDIVRAANGTTIQVIHTDAEGRMVLADTLVLAGRSKPALILDFATLTGAAVQALTERMSAVFAPDSRLVAPLLEAARISGERVVLFPMDADFDADIDSKVADVAQCAVEGKGDHILAARFLQRFVPVKMPWIHVDLASATRTGGLGHVTTDVIGFGVRLVMELLQGQNVLNALGQP